QDRVGLERHRGRLPRRGDRAGMPAGRGNVRDRLRPRVPRPDAPDPQAGDREVPDPDRRRLLDRAWGDDPARVERPPGFGPRRRVRRGGGGAVIVGGGGEPGPRGEEEGSLVKVRKATAEDVPTLVAMYQELDRMQRDWRVFTPRPGFYDEVAVKYRES